MNVLSVWKIYYRETPSPDYHAYAFTINSKYNATSGLIRLAGVLISNYCLLLQAHISLMSVNFTFFQLTARLLSLLPLINLTCRFSLSLCTPPLFILNPQPQ